MPTSPSAQAPAPDMPAIEHVVAGPSSLESSAEWLSCATLLVMIGLIGAETVARNVFETSLQVTDEICGYLLVAITFLSLSVSEAHGAYHRVELIQARMSVRHRLWLQLFFDGCAWVVSVLVAWQLGRLAWNAWNAGDVAPTPLQTPLWIPQSVMGLGMAMLCLSLLRSLRAKYRALQQEVAS